MPSSLPKNHLQQNLVAQKNSGGSLLFCFCIHVWMRSKTHQHRSWTFRKKIVNCIYISNRCSFTLREKTQNTSILSTVCGTHFGSFTEFFGRESKPPLTQTQRIFLRSHRILIVLKTFLTNPAAVPKYGKHERRLLRELRKKIGNFID